PDQAVVRLRAGLDLWQADHALAGLTVPGARRIAEQLDELRLAAAEQLAELELERGHPDQVLARLRGLAGIHLASGRLIGAWMGALQATGRGGGALSWYGRAEQVARGHGRDVSEATQRAHTEVVDGQAPRLVTGPAAGAPFQLPADTSHFTGRAAEMARLR